MVLGQIALVRPQQAGDGGRRRGWPAAVDAVFRADVAMKSSGGEPRVLLERLVVELCTSRTGARAGGMSRGPQPRAGR